MYKHQIVPYFLRSWDLLQEESIVAEYERSQNILIHYLIFDFVSPIRQCPIHFIGRRGSQYFSPPWKLVLILVVTNLVRTNAVVAKPLLIVVRFVRQPIGPSIKNPALDVCARWAWPISTRLLALVENRTGRSHYVTVTSQQRN